MVYMDVVSIDFIIMTGVSNVFVTKRLVTNDWSCNQKTWYLSLVCQRSKLPMTGASKV